MLKQYYLFVLLLLLLSCNNNQTHKESKISQPEYLTSWNDGIAKSNIITYVEDITNPQSEHFISVKDRIAVFDNDGTMWSERPIYFQFYFVIDRLKEMAPQHPEWHVNQPFKSILEDEPNALLKSGHEGIAKVLDATMGGTTEREFQQIVSDWVKTAKHPESGKLYTYYVYKPMLELLDYLRDNNFKIYIVSGGSLEFMRPIICEIYNIPEEQILGTTYKTVYDYNDGEPLLKRLNEMSFYNDKGNKVVNIQNIIGKKPVFCGGNSDGDLAMMQWTSSNKLKSFMLYVHHTDSIREWAYDRESPIGKLDKGLDQAIELGWTVVDMKNDWRTIFEN
ncbi:MAG: haloacid dehalogenase [Marinilabiliales bacterium]|nr:MAG: haloacid dehalogenase [Marinilabiliales bacterium]